MPNENQYPSLLMTVSEVASTLKVSVRSIWRWTSQSTIPAPIQIGSVKRWERKVIEQFLRDRARQTLR